jgi:AraC family transcriptional regulator
VVPDAYSVDSTDRHQDAAQGVFGPVPVMTAVVDLLECAQEAVLRDAKEASRCIAKARDLIRGECYVAKQTSFDSGSVRLPPWRLRRVLAFVEANLSNAIQVKDLAAEARLSVCYLSHLFRNTIGQSPFAYVRRRRIERAKHLMLLTEKSLAEIAGECGLCDQAHFSRLFRQMVGMSPAAWRRLRCG